MNSTTARIFGLTAAYGLLYSLLGEPHFEFKDAIDPYYFSISTMTSTGYGDLSPRTATGKLAVMSQQALMLGNLMYALVG